MLRCSDSKVCSYLAGKGLLYDAKCHWHSGLLWRAMAMEAMLLMVLILLVLCLALHRLPTRCAHRVPR